MTKFTIVSVLALTGWSSYGLRAQTLQDGIWTGEMHPSNEADGFAVSMEVTNGPDGLAIDFTASRGNVPPLRLSDVELTGDTLAFTMPVADGIDCTLAAQDSGGYAGECVAANYDMSARLSLVPPED